jgi:hypothetical protein
MAVALEPEEILRLDIPSRWGNGEFSGIGRWCVHISATFGTARVCVYVSGIRHCEGVGQGGVFILPGLERVEAGGGGEIQRGASSVAERGAEHKLRHKLIEPAGSRSVRLRRSGVHQCVPNVCTNQAPKYRLTCQCGLHSGRSQD